MKYVLVLSLLLLASCGGMSQLGKDAIAACAKQSVFNEVASGAALFGPQAAIVAVVSSAAVGVGCTWVNQ